MKYIPDDIYNLREAAQHTSLHLQNARSAIREMDSEQQAPLLSAARAVCTNALAAAETGVAPAVQRELLPPAAIATLPMEEALTQANRYAMQLVNLPLNENADTAALRASVESLREEALALRSNAEAT